MEVKRICAAYWSATGNTDKTVNTIAEALAKKLDVPLERRSFTRPAERAQPLVFEAGDLVVFGMPTYAGKLVMLAISIVLISVGVLMYVSVRLVPMPMEGLSLAITEKAGIPFHNTKMIIDCIVVGVSVLLSFLAFHSLVGIREGTVVTAIVVGRVMAVIRRPLVPLIDRVCFGAVAAPEEECGGELSAEDAASEVG